VNGYLLAGLLVLVVAGALVALIATVRMYASADGERLRKRRMQGSFVPLGTEDITEDEQRIRERPRSGDGKP
jgi:NADH:ubiquinone oxidoreductase subunit 6 (subunit J)